MLAQPVLAQIRETVSAETGRPAHARGAPVYARTDAPGALHCRVTVYFSPGASELAERLGARPCAAPPRDGLELIAGYPG